MIAARLANNGTNGRNAVAVAEAAANICCRAARRASAQGADADHRGHPRGHPRRRTVEAAAGDGLSDKPLRDRRADRRDGSCRSRRRSMRSAMPAGTIWSTKREPASITFAGGELRISPTPAMTLIDVDGFLPPDELAVLGAARSSQGHPPARHRRVDRDRSADRGEQGSAPGRCGGDRRGAAAAVRADRGQRLRLRPDRPPPRSRVARRAGAGPRRVRGPRAAAASGVRDGRARSASSRIPPSSRR